MTALQALPFLSGGRAFILSAVQLHSKKIQDFFVQKLPKCGAICYNERDFDNKEGCLS